MKHLAIDLETLSLNENAHILSIGAVFFCPETKRMGSSFYIETLRGVQQKDAHLSAQTMEFWIGQPAGTMTVMPENEHMELGEALQYFVNWVHRHQRAHGLQVYQQGTKDSTWIDNACERYGVMKPWDYYRVYCGRTLWAHHKVAGDFTELEGTQHNALDDARWLANRMIEVLS